MPPRPNEDAAEKIVVVWSRSERGQAREAEQGAERSCPPAAPLMAPNPFACSGLGRGAAAGPAGGGGSGRQLPSIACHTEPLLLGLPGVGVGLLGNAEGAVFVLGSTQGFPMSSESTSRAKNPRQV